MLIGYATYKNTTGLKDHDKDFCFEWSLATGYTCDGVTIAKSKSEFAEYMTRFLDEHTLADNNLKGYLA